LAHHSNYYCEVSPIFCCEYYVIVLAVRTRAVECAHFISGMSKSLTQCLCGCWCSSLFVYVWEICDQMNWVLRGILFAHILTRTALHWRLLNNIAFYVVLLPEFSVFVCVIFTESRVMKYDFRVIWNGVTVLRRINFRRL
jgi:hypothetical protein